MSFSITNCGGALLIMMGHNTRSESLFYYFRIEDQIPEDHLLRPVDRHVDFAFVREHIRKLSQTPEFADARRARNKIEALFSELQSNPAPQGTLDLAQSLR